MFKIVNKKNIQARVFVAIKNIVAPTPICCANSVISASLQHPYDPIFAHTPNGLPFYLG